VDIVRLPGRSVPFVKGVWSALPGGASWERLLAGLKGCRAVVHGQDALLAGELGVKIARECNLPSIVHAHSSLFEDVGGDLLPRFWSPLASGLVTPFLVRLARKVCAQANKVVVVKEYVAKGLQSHLPVQPTILPCGIEPPGSPDLLDIRARHQIDQDASLLLYVGRLDPDKYIRDLLLAFRHIHHQEPKARLLLVGGGPYAPRYQQLAGRLNLDKAAIFVGWVPYDLVWSYYSQADLFLITSPHEAQGLVLLEAQACGLPVAGYRSGGIRLMVKEGITGILTSPRPEALAQAALELMADTPRRAAFGTAAREWSQNFSADVMFQQLLDLYSAVIH